MVKKLSRKLRKELELRSVISNLNMFTEMKHLIGLNLSNTFHVGNNLLISSNYSIKINNSRIRAVLRALQNSLEGLECWDSEKDPTRRPFISISRQFTPTDKLYSHRLVIYCLKLFIMTVNLRGSN